MLNTKYQYPLFLVTIASWWSLTAFADLMMAPSIFRVVENFFNAGDLAMSLFTRFNNLEIVISTAFLILCALIYRRRGTKVVLILGIISWAIALFYFIYLIPKIVDLTELWKKAESMGVVGIENIEDVQKEHQLFHRIYIIVDSIKLLILSFLLSVGIFSQERIK